MQFLNTCLTTFSISGTKRINTNGSDFLTFMYLAFNFRNHQFYIILIVYILSNKIKDFNYLLIRKTSINQHN